MNELQIIGAFFAGIAAAYLFLVNLFQPLKKIEDKQVRKNIILFRLSGPGTIFIAGLAIFLVGTFGLMKFKYLMFHFGFPLMLVYVVGNIFYQKAMFFKKPSSYIIFSIIVYATLVAVMHLLF